MNDLDRLTEALRDAEDALAEVYDVPAEVDMVGSTTLRWGKEGSEWRLTVTSFGGGETPLLRTSALIRTRAAHALAPLREALDKQIVERERAVLAAIVAATEFTMLLRLPKREAQTGGDSR